MMKYSGLKYFELPKAIEEFNRRLKDQVLTQKVSGLLNGCPVPSGKYGFIVPKIDVLPKALTENDFHHRLQDSMVNVVDLSHWLDQFKSLEKSYLYFLMLAINRGILIDLEHHSDDFSNQIIDPALMVFDALGFPPPLMVHYCPDDEIETKKRMSFKWHPID